MRKVTLLLSLIAYLTLAQSQSNEGISGKSQKAQSVQDNHRLLYFGQDPPNEKARIFAPGIISVEGQYEFGSVFSKSGKAFYYAIDNKGRAEILSSKLVGEKWTAPKVILKDDQYGYNDPMLSPDENRLYFISNQPPLDRPNADDIDIWYIEKMNGSWSKPINAGKTINSSKNEYYISFSQEGTMYFASNIESSSERNHDFDIYSSRDIGDAFEKPEKLSDSINTKRYEADVFIAPDESYIIFCANRADGLGRGDLYISFRDNNGDWTTSKNMGPGINTTGHELCPFVTADGKYFFYTSNKDIYWVSTSIFRSLK